MNRDYKIGLVTSWTWHDFVVEAFRGRSLKNVSLARTILSTMHNRHIGITPDLAVDLALFILEPSTPPQPWNPWGVVIQRLCKELGVVQEISDDSHSSEQVFKFAVLLSTIPPYSVMRLAMPIIERACQTIGKCFLFCQEHLENTVSKEAYKAYSNELENEIRQMAAKESDFMQIFWKDRALTLANYSRRPFKWRRSAAGLPEIDPAALDLLLQVKPDIPQSKHLSHHPKPLTEPIKHREIPRIKEGGFSGIHITHRPEDIGNILMSEFIYPPEILTDRLLNTGYLALRRQPKREKMRDVLMVGVMPAGLKPKINADFVKACWFDFIAWFGYKLFQSKLFRSEFRWLEGDDLGRAANCNFLLQDFPLQYLSFEDDPPLNYRQEFLITLGWLPHYLDLRRCFDRIPGYEPSGDQETENHKEPTRAEEEWAFAAWKAQKENRQWMAYEPHPPILSDVSEERLAVDQFSFVHIMVFLPAEKRPKESISPAVLLGRFHSGLGLGSPTEHRVSITWVPKKVDAFREWGFDASGCCESLFPVQSQGTCDKIAARLEKAWRDQVLKEIWHV